MARFSVNAGIDDFARDIGRMSELSGDQKYSIISAGAEVLKAKMKEVLNRLGLRDTGRLIESIAAAKKTTGGELFALVYPRGSHHAGKQKNVTAAEVGFILEYGSAKRSIKAYHWMETSVRESEEAISEAMQTQLNSVLDNLQE